MTHHRPTIVGAIIGALIVTLAIMALSARAHAQPLDAGLDPVVLADHAAPLALAAPPPVDPPAKVAPGPLDRILEIAGPVGRGALGGIACLLRLAHRSHLPRQIRPRIADGGE